MPEFDAKYHEGAYDPQEWCDHEWDIVKLSDILYEGHCKKCGVVNTRVMKVEYWSEKEKKNSYMRVAGKMYRALKGWSDVVPCCECGKVFFEVPLILWSMKDPSKAIVFCSKCAEEILKDVFDKDGLDYP